MLAKNLIRFAALLICSVWLACESLDKFLQPNERPVIDRFFAVRNQLLPGDTTTIVVEAHDPEGQALSYTWTQEAGTLSSTSGTSVLWTAPQLSRDYRITVEVSDASNNKTESSLAIKILTLQAITIDITQPREGDFIPGLGEVTILARTSPPAGANRVDFWAGGEFLGSDHDAPNSEPYQIRWRIDGLSGPKTIVTYAYRSEPNIEPGVDSLHVSLEGVTPVR